MVRWTLIFAVALALLLGVSPATAADPETDAANAAVEYIIGLQNPDGGFPGFGDESAPGVTLDAVFALVAAGVDPSTVSNAENSPADYLRAVGAEYAEDPGAAAKLALSWVVLFGDFPGDAPEFRGLALLDFYDPGTGQYGVDVFDQAFWILGLALFLRGTDTPGLSTSAAYLLSLQLDDGGWEFSAGFGSDSNSTAMAVQALLAADVSPEDPAVVAALEYFHSTQNAAGGFAFLPDTDPDAQSTAFVIQALVAAGEDIDVGGPWERNGATPIEALLSFQNPDTGAFQFAGEDSPFATYQVVPALMLAPFPSLETQADGVTEGPVDTLIPVAKPTAESPTAMPEADVADVPDLLPSAGVGPGTDGAAPWAAIALAAGGTVAIIAGVVRRKLS